MGQILNTFQAERATIHVIGGQYYLGANPEFRRGSFGQWMKTPGIPFVKVSYDKVNETAYATAGDRAIRRKAYAEVH